MRYYIVLLQFVTQKHKISEHDYQTTENSNRFMTIIYNSMIYSINLTDIHEKITVMTSEQKFQNGLPNLFLFSHYRFHISEDDS